MNYADLPVSVHPLNERERWILLERLNALIAYLGSPGDWGYESKLGQMTMHLKNLRHEINVSAETKSG